MKHKNNIFDIGEPIDIKHSKREQQNRWFDETQIFHQKKSGGEEFITPNFDLKKIRLLLLLVIAIFVFLFFRIGYLQIVRGQDYRSAAEENRIRISEIKAPRGIMYDRAGKILAHNIPNFTLSFTPSDLPDNESQLILIIEKIDLILSKNYSEIEAIINEAPQYSYQSFLIEDHIPYDQAILLKIASADLPGITLNVSTFREYLANNHFSHVLGYMGKITEEEIIAYPDYSRDDYLGKTGLELFFESELRGINGKKEIEVNALGKESKVVTESRPEPGKNLILSIDSDLQEALSSALEETINDSSNATGGAAIAMDPNNGEIIAFVSAPTFNNNAFTFGISVDEYNKIISDPNKPLFNRAISGEYPSGSTIKPLMALAALNERIINQNTTFLSTGGIRIDKWWFPDWKAGGHGLTDVKKAISDSVNTFFYLIGGGDENIDGLGVTRIKSYLELFGLNNRLGIDYPGERPGFLPTKEWKEETKNEPWYIGDTYHLSIGQGDLLVTPLQIASYTATIANGGTVYVPHLVKEFTDQNNESLKNIDPIIIRENFIDASYYKIVQEGLRQGVTEGSSRALANMPMAVAGKTGTAQFGNEGKTHAWFTSYAPYDNPQIVITVLIEGGGGGDVVALPVAKKGLLKWYEKYLE